MQSFGRGVKERWGGGKHEEREIGTESHSLPFQASKINFDLRFPIAAQHKNLTLVLLGKLKCPSSSNRIHRHLAIRRCTVSKHSATSDSI